MLERITVGTEGVADYLVNGQKSGRNYTRDELDERVPLYGDLAITDAIIQSMNTKGAKYMHITLGFKEDDLSDDRLKEIFDCYLDLALSAYEKDEVCCYVEAHRPKIKSYVNSKTGETVERKLHGHNIIALQNMLTGGALNVFGKHEHSLKYREAIQEYINEKFGLASPADNRRTGMSDESDIISRYKGDEFEGSNRLLRERVFDAMMSRQITNMDDFAAMLGEVGEVKIRNAGRANEYLNVLEPESKKGVNLKNFVFTREFVELSMAEKRSRLVEVAKIRYEETSGPRESSQQRMALLKEWREVVSRKIKYVNSGTKAGREYKTASPERRLEIINECEAKYLAKYRPERIQSNDKRVEDGRGDRWIEHERDGRSELLDRDIPRNGAGLRDPSVRRTGSSNGKKAVQKSRARQLAERSAPIALNSLRGLSQLDVARLPDRGEVLLPRHARDQLEHQRAQRADQLRRDDPGSGDRGRVSKGNLANRFASELGEKNSREAQESRAEFVRIKSGLDARRLLVDLSHSHGLLPQKYEVVKAKDGTDRIACGKRNLNVSDFLTREMNLPWSEAAPILRDCYARQMSDQTRQEPRAQIDRTQWAEFMARHRNVEAERRQALADLSQTNERERARIRTNYQVRKQRVQMSKAFTAVERRQAVSVLRMEKIERENALCNQIRVERAKLKGVQRVSLRELHREFLRVQAEKGDEAALQELRRQRGLDPVQSIKPVAVIEGAGAHVNGIEYVRPEMVAGWEVKYRQNGDVAYYRDGREKVVDSDRKVSVVDHDREAIETALRLAKAKFGYKLTLTGTRDKVEDIARVAGEMGINVEFTDPSLTRVLEQRRAELRAERAADAALLQRAREFAAEVAAQNEIDRAALESIEKFRQAEQAGRDKAQQIPPGAHPAQGSELPKQSETGPDQSSGNDLDDDRHGRGQGWSM